MTTTYPAIHVSTAIGRSFADVYDFVADPANVPRWAAGLGGSIENVDGRWFADSPMGRVEVAFVPRNELGVVDHVVTLPGGEVVLNPLRVLKNGEGAEVVFTLFRRPGVDDAAFDADAAAVSADLASLKRLLDG